MGSSTITDIVPREYIVMMNVYKYVVLSSQNRSQTSDGHPHVERT